MRRVFALPLVLGIMFCASDLPALQLGNAAPRITVYRPSETQVVVYDARPELGIAVDDTSKPARAMVDKLGIRLARRILHWNKMEPTDKPGLYDASYLAEWDKLVEECRKAGIYLVAVVDGEAPGVGYEDREAAYQRYARFASDMAARYPSVVFWELFNQPDSQSASLFGGKDGIPARERGANYAAMLRVAYPVIRAANPSAWVLCAGTADAESFARGVYEGGGRGYFDIMTVHTPGPLAAAFVERGEAVRKVMAEYGDEAKPIWSTELGSTPGDSGHHPDDYQGCFDKNNSLRLYQKLLPRQCETLLMKLLEGDRINSSILAKPRTIMNMFVPTKVPMVAIGYDCKQVEGGIEIQRVLVDTLVPTRISLMHISEPEPPQPGQKPTPVKKGTRPIPDPFDI